MVNINEWLINKLMIVALINFWGVIENENENEIDRKVTVLSLQIWEDSELIPCLNISIDAFWYDSILFKYKVNHFVMFVIYQRFKLKKDVIILY